MREEQLGQANFNSDKEFRKDWACGRLRSRVGTTAREGDRSTYFGHMERSDPNGSTFSLLSKH